MLLSFSGFMLPSIFGSFVLLSCIDHVNAEPRVIHMKTKRNTRKGLHKRDISSDDEVTVTAQGLMWYSVNLTVGTPGSTVRVHIDTGSSITWMTSPEASNNETVGSPIFFTPTDSSTYKFKNGEFHMEYVDKTVVDGDYFTDDLMLQGMKMQNVELGLAKKGGVDGDGKVGGGVMGLGPDANRVNLLDEMVNQSLIKSHTFSLWLDTLEAGSGNVLFGGYDNAKFDGELGLIPVLPPQNSWTVYVAGVVVDHDGEQTTIDMEQFPVLLDSGTSWSSLPTAVFDPLADLLTAIKAEPDNDKSNAWLVPCDVRDRDGAGLYLQFGSTDGPWINIPFSMLAVSSDDQPQTDDGRQLCSFGFERGRDNDTSFLFGDTFLRSAYVFHDLDRMQIGIAQALSAVTEANYQEVSNQVDDVVSASSVEGATYSADAKITRARLPGDGAYSGSVSVVTVPTTTPTSLSGGIATTITVDKAKTDPPTTSSSATQTSSSAATPAAQEHSTLPVLILALCGSLLLMGAMIV